MTASASVGASSAHATRRGRLGAVLACAAASLLVPAAAPVSAGSNENRDPVRAASDTAVRVMRRGEVNGVIVGVDHGAAHDGRLTLWIDPFEPGAEALHLVEIVPNTTVNDDRANRSKELLGIGAYVEVYGRRQDGGWLAYQVEVVREEILGRIVEVDTENWALRLEGNEYEGWVDVGFAEIRLGDEQIELQYLYRGDWVVVEGAPLEEAFLAAKVRLTDRFGADLHYEDYARPSAGTVTVYYGHDYYDPWYWDSDPWWHRPYYSRPIWGHYRYRYGHRGDHGDDGKDKPKPKPKPKPEQVKRFPRPRRAGWGSPGPRPAKHLPGRRPGERSDPQPTADTQPAQPGTGSRVTAPADEGPKYLPGRRPHRARAQDEPRPETTRPTPPRGPTKSFGAASTAERARTILRGTSGSGSSWPASRLRSSGRSTAPARTPASRPEPRREETKPDPPKQDKPASSKSEPKPQSKPKSEPKSKPKPKKGF